MATMIMDTTADFLNYGILTPLRDLKAWWGRVLEKYAPVLLDGEDDIDDDGAADDNSDTGDAGAGDDDHTGESGDDHSGSGDDGDDDGDGDDEDDDDTDDDPMSLALAKIEKLESKIEELGGGAEEGEQAADTDTGKSSPRDMQVEYDDTNHKYHGLTFGELFDRDPDEAYRVSPYHATNLQLEGHSQKAQQEQKDIELQESLKKEKEDFANYYVKDVLGQDKAYDSLSDPDKVKVDSVTDEVMGWMVETGKYGITVSDAYFLMDRAGQVTRAMQKVVRDATAGNVRNVSSVKEGEGDNNQADMSKWTNDQMAAYLDTLSGDKFSKFLSTAPKAVRKKFPSLPYS